MDTETAKKILKSKGHEIVSEKRLGNDTGTQLKLKTGQSVNVYDKGNVFVQGNDKELIENLLDAEKGSPKRSLSTKIFVVYGHDTQAREQLENLLRKWSLDPIILDQLPSEGKTIIEKLGHYSENVGFAVVLATPDDESHRKGYPDEKAYRARQNVVLELGMMLTKLGREKVAILIKNPDAMERPSDIQGLIYIPFKDHVKEAQIQLAKEMNEQGYQIDIEGLMV